ncbi:hypothetical protein [Candidatus Nitronereus thalassa]|uniref:Uncharacterized protein n=1 Tax=Candidatus Nitronereus thalassa TaxID=3020898 RepID=A0ABU3K3A6_9BACT|nr:hypothetical protein [Candidatus Nitronereus thalassa]MDT7040856.1 hypothetical protein [Candidatus Nitronereus thalassa]
MKGWKTWVATIGFGLCEALKAFFPEQTAGLSALQHSVFMPLGVVGLGHKLEKVTRA